jgi:hypothetical protein
MMPMFWHPHMWWQMYGWWNLLLVLPVLMSLGVWLWLSPTAHRLLRGALRLSS